MKDLITLVIPCFNEAASLPLFWEELKKVMNTMPVDFELIFIDDGSTDGTLSFLRRLAETDARVFYRSFSRNFGKEAAIYAGLSAAHGRYVALMDADLQDPPQLLPQMYQAVSKEGYDSAATRRITRKGEPPIRSFFAHQFYRFINCFLNFKIVDGARDYRLMNRQFVDALLKLTEYNRFSKGLFGWVGFKTKWIPFENVQRIAGETKWSFWGLFKYSLEGITAFTTAPLVFTSFVGLILCLASFTYVLYIFTKTLLYGDPVAGWPTLICAVTFLSGIQLLFMGIFGQYMAKLYLEIKRRPIYIIAEENTTPEPSHTQD